jgi:O-antigen ligase
VAIGARHLPKWHTSVTESRLTRLEFWKVARGVIHDHFWTGIGIKGWESQYAVNVRKYAPYPPLNWASPQPHDVFLDSFVKAGLPGFLAITALLLWPIGAGISVARRRGPESWYGIAIASCGVALLVFGIIDDPLWSDDMIPLLFIVYSGLSYVLVRTKKIQVIS